MQPISNLSTALIDMLGYTARQHEVVSQNIANVNTPGFKTLTLSFPDATAPLRGERPPDGNLDARLVLREEQGLAERPDGNNVDIDRELGRLSKNSLLYQTFTELLAADFDAFRRAIQLK